MTSHFILNLRGVYSDPDPMPSSWSEPSFTANLGAPLDLNPVFGEPYVSTEIPKSFGTKEGLPTASSAASGQGLPVYVEGPRRSIAERVSQHVRMQSTHVTIAK